MRKLLILLLLPLTAMAVPPKTPKEQADAFLASVVSGNVTGGYDQLFKGTSMAATKPQALAMLKSQTQAQLPLFGKVVGFELLKEEAFGTSIVRLVYALKSEIAPTIWVFHFYKTTGPWTLSNVAFNDDLKELR